MKPPDPEKRIATLETRLAHERDRRLDAERRVVLMRQALDEMRRTIKWLLAETRPRA